jgi:uncharacterized protein YbjQ (UPF0145 family)
MSDQPAAPSLTQAAMARLQAAGAGAGGAPPRLFTSDLSVDEFLLIRDAGFDPIGLVMGSSVYHVGIQYGGWKQSMELTVLTAAMYNARQLAMYRMQAEADAMNADGIVGVQLEIRQNAGYGDLLDFVAVGTAVRARENPTAWRTPAGRAFTSDLSGQDFWKLWQAGYVPVSFVLGTCVYHIAHQSLRQMMKQMGQNVEMPNFTQATYDAREIAMARMQAEAERDQAMGVVGVLVRENSHVWGEHGIEFLATGTSVRMVQEREHAITSPMVLSLDSR